MTSSWQWSSNWTLLWADFEVDSKFKLVMNAGWSWGWSYSRTWSWGWTWIWREVDNNIEVEADSKVEVEHNSKYKLIMKLS